MKSIGNQDDELGSLIPSHEHSSDGLPANPSNNSLSIVSRER
jgi:hypothetical protein